MCVCVCVCVCVCMSTFYICIIIHSMLQKYNLHNIKSSTSEIGIFIYLISLKDINISSP